MRFAFSVEPKDSGERVDVYLAGQLADTSRSFLQKLLREGHVLVNDAPVRPNARLREDDQVVLDLPEQKEMQILPEDIPLDILYEDDDLLVVNKPKNLVVHPAAGHAEHTLVNALLYHCHDSLSGINGVLRPGIVHRIDKDTTGALVVCKNDRAHRILADQLACHSITRRYQAICIGRIEEELRIEKNIGRHRTDRKRMAVVSDTEGKPAVTLVHPLQQLNGYTHIECELLTGRTHQIRVHLASLGHHVLGDPVYGPSKSPVRGLEGQVLHAKMIGFRHPSTGAYMEIEAPLPAYFQALLVQLA